jgi:hypothetical protein
LKRKVATIDGKRFGETGGIDPASTVTALMKAHQ